MIERRVESFYELDVLKFEIEKYPDLFTEDLKFYLAKLDRDIESFLKVLDK